MFLSNTAIKKPVMTTMFILVFILFGVMAYFGIPIDMFPEVNIPYISINTVYPGSGPKEIETQITDKIEEKIATISGIDMIESYSMQNLSMIIVKFEMSKDPDIANQEIKDKVNTVLSMLPDDAEQPTIEKFEMGAYPIMELILTGDPEQVTGRELFDYAENRLKDRFAQIAGVARIELKGGKEREIRIETNNKALFENDLTINTISGVISSNNSEISAGYYINQGMEISLKTDSEFENLEELSELEIPIAGGTKRLSELAKIIDGNKDIRNKSIYYNNITKVVKENIVKFEILKSSDANTVALAKEVYKLLPKLEKSLPSGMNIELLHDNSRFIKSSVDDTLSNLLLGILLTGFVLFLFLHDWRSTLIVALSMPTSIISTFMVMKAVGFSFNMLSLMGLSTAVGVLVSNSIVVLENIFRFKNMGLENKESAAKGTGQVATAVIASTATNLVVFLPIASMTSMAGQFFKEFALTVSFATIFSLLMSFTLTPMLASLILPKKEKVNAFGKVIETFFHKFEGIYTKILKSLLKNKLRPILFGIFMLVLMIAVMGIIAPKLGFEFMPEFDEGDLMIKAELPQGYSLERTAEKMSEIEKILLSHKEVKQVLTTLGDSKGTYIGLASVKLVDSTRREIKTSAMNQLFIEELSSVSNAKISCRPNREEQNPIEYIIVGADKDKLESYMPEVNRKMKEISGLINYDTSFRTGKPELTLIPKRRILSETGMSAMDLAMTVRSASEGIIASVFREKGLEYDIRVCLEDVEINTPEELSALTVITPTGKYTISQLADVTYTEGVTQIMHRDKLPCIKITGGTASGVPLGNITKEIDKVLDSMEFSSDIFYKQGGDAEMMQETNIDMAIAFLIAIVLTYMLLASILENFFYPFLILTTLPMATIGVFVLMFVTGTTMNLFSMMAVIMLIGLVVNDAILILDYTRLLIQTKGMSVKDALIEACPTKMKAVLMTSMAIVLGMMPMALGFGSSGKEMRIPMAMVQIGGMATSTILTLLLIPSLYYVFSKKENTRE